MNATTYTNLQQNLETYLDSVVLNKEPLMITRQDNNNVVLLSVDEYNSLMETNYLLSNDANTKHLQASISQHKTGKIQIQELHEDA